MTNVYFNLIQREEMARNLWYKRSNTTGNSVSVDSSTDGGTTLAEYPGNHPVITQLSPRNHPLLDAIWKHVAMIFAVLVMSVANIGTAWGAYESDPYVTVTAKDTIHLVAKKSTLLFRDVSSKETLSTGAILYGGAYQTSSQSKDWTVNISDNPKARKLENQDYWFVLYSPDAFVAGDSIVVGSGYNSSNNYWLKFMVASSTTYNTDLHSGSSIVNPNATDWEKNVDYYYILPANFTTSNYIAFKANGGTMYYKYIKFYHKAVAPSCTAPSSVGITGTNKYLAGQDINLTATPTGHTGTPTYQWQKEINSVWTNVTNGDNISGATTNNLQITSCDHYNSGQYRCVVSTGSESCTTNSDAFGVHVFSVYGGYVGESWSDNEIQFTSGTSGKATIHLNAGSLYKFHIRSNNGAYYSNGTADYNGDGNADDGTTDGWYTLGTISGWSFGRSDKNFRIYTGAEGDYEITVDIANALVSGDYVTVGITYPTPVHPSAGYVYFEKPSEWTNVYLYWYTNDNSRLTGWDGAPEITATTSICGTTYYYTPLGTTFSNVIFKGNGSNQWTSISTSGCSGKYLDKTNYSSPYWHDFTTYTISFANGGGTGTMSAITGICPNSNQAITANAFEKTGHTFNCWHADKAVKVGGNTIAIGGDIAGGATLQEINNNITLTAQWSPEQYDITLEKGSADAAPAGNSGSAKVLYNGTELTNITHATWTGHVLTGYYTSNSGGTKVLNADGTFAGANVSGYITDNKWTRAENTTVKAQWTAKTTTITINANTANHGSTTPGTVTATYGSALPSFTAAAGESGYSLTGYFTAATGGNKIINADGSLVRNTTYSTDESTPKWKSEAATLTLFAQYEEEVVSPSKCITFNSTSAPSVSGVTIKKVAGGDGGSTYTEDGFYMSKSGDYITFDISALGNLTKATFTAKTNSTSKKIGYGYTDNTTTIGEVPGGDGTADKDFHEYEITGIPGNTTRFTIIRKGTGTTITEVCLFYTPISCSTPAAPTGFTAGSITSTGATFTITDAAGAASYDIYYSTSNTAPNASTVATTTSTSKTKAVTGLTANTTYYAWVRSVCDADHKSAWVALTGSSFETSAAAGTTYYLVTSTAQLNTTDTYVIMDDGKAAMMGIYGSNAMTAITSGFTAAADKSTVTVSSSDVNTLTLQAESTAWNIVGKDDNKLTTNSTIGANLYGNTPKANSDTKDDFVFEFANGKATIKRNTETNYHIYYTSGTGFNQSTSSTNIRLYTSNSTPVYTVTYDLNGGTGTVPTNRPEKSGTEITLASSAGLTNDGFTFDGWLCSVNSTKYNAGALYTMTAANTTFTAQWVAAESYSITYDCDGAESGCPAYVAAATNLPNPLPSAPTKSGYTFGGWYTDSEKTVAAVAGAALSENTTLYAKWTEDECTPTTLFSMVVSNSASNYNLAAGTTITQADDAISSRLSSISGGGISITNNSGSSNKTVFASNALSLLNADVQCAIALTGATLQEGDVITVTTTSSGKPYLTSTAAKSNEVTWSTSSYTHSITLANTSNATGKNLIGKSTFYLWYGGSAVYIRLVTVTRPCDESAETCKTPNITNVANTTNMTTAETKSLNVTVSNTTALTGTVSYAWTNSDGTAIATAANASGANTARLTLTEPAAGTYTFKCTVTNDCGGGDSQSATSAVFTVVVTESTGCTEIAKVNVSGTSTGTDSGTKIAETGGYGVKLENTTASHGGNTGYKIGSNNYVYLQLASGEQFQNGDKVKVYITHLSDQGDNKLHIFQGTTAAGTEVATVESPALGWNEAPLSNVTTGNRSLTIHRSSGTTEQNHYIYAFAVERCVDCTPATHEGLAYTKTSYTVGETAEALTVTNPENVDTYQWKWNTTNDRTGGTNCGTNAASFTPPTTSDVAGTRYYWCELTNDCGTVKTSAVGITVSADLSDVTVTWTDPAGTVNYGGGGYTIKATVGPAAWDGTLNASMLTAPEGIRIYDVEINNTEHTLQAKFDVQTTFDREANATAIPFALTLAATANYDGKIDEHDVAYSACAAGGGGGILFSQNFNDATEVAYTNGTSTEITTSSGNNIVGSTAASQFTYIGIVNKSSTGIAINTESGGKSQDITGAFQAYANNTSGKYALVKKTNFAATAPTALRIEADVWFHTLNSSSNYSLSFAVGEGFSNSTGGASASDVHSGFSFCNASAVYLYAYKSTTNISGTNQFTQSNFQKVTWVINNTGDDLEYTNPAGTKSTLANDKFDVWVGTKQFVSGQAATTPAKALQNLYIGDPNGKGHEFRLDNVTVTDISTSSGTGTITTALTWSNDQASGATLEKDEGTADFAVTANRDAAATTSLGALTYSSSDPSVATVNATTGQVHIADNIDFGGAIYKETTITATLAASGCYKRAEITYVLQVNAHPCEDVAGTITTEDSGCDGIKLTLSGYTTGATIQWYKDGVAILSATSATYTATAAGEYYAVTHSTCDRTSNTVTIASAAVSATKIVDEWYVKNGRRTPDIALVQTTNATGFTVTTGGSPITSIGGCEFYLGTDGIIYLEGSHNGSAPSGMTEGDDVLSITATGCSDAAPVSVTIHRQVETDKYVLAYVVTGKQDGGWTQDMPSNQTTGVELYRTLTNHFDLQATNVYATTDEQKIKEYYSRYDIIFITDYPNTKTKNETTKKSYVDALGALIDIRPILTMEAWVSGLSNWNAKGVAGNPKSPTTRQYNMLLQCKDHEIFSGTTVETIGEGDEMMFKINMVDSTQALYDTLDTKYGAGAHAETTGYRYGKHPALQGFVYDEALADMLPLGLIDDGAGNDLQVGLERQKEMEARMMVLGINADAMERLSEDGETVIVNALKYLMKKDAEDISDCSIYFDNAGGDHLWSNVANWGPSHLTLPQPTQEARILQPCIVDGAVAKAASVKIVTDGTYNHGSSTANGSLTIRPTGKLSVGGRIVAASAPNYYEVRPTDAAQLVIEANNLKTGALIHGHKSGELNATVQLVSKAYSERVTEDGKTKTKKYWQYVGLPVQEALAEEAFYGGYTYKYEESAGWEKKRTGDMLEEFWGIGLSYDNYVLGKASPITFNISGALALATNRDIELTKTAEAGNGENMIGNSWTAPIHLVNMTAEDFENATATIYLFNTGRNDSHTNSAFGSTTAGQWVSVPVAASKQEPWVGPKVIPAMQAFEVDVAGGATSGTLHLNYDKHVRAIATIDEENQPLRAPKRYMDEEPMMLRLRVADSATYTDLYLIEGEQLSDEFDNGWDGKYQQCDGRSATLYALSPIGNMAVLAQQSVDNTVVVFRPGKYTDYTFTFGNSGEESYYLNDVQLETSTEIKEGNEYRFTCNEGDMESRFVVSTTPFGAPDIATGIGNAGHPEKVQKIMYKDHIYIIRGGRIYDVVGKMVK